MIHHKLNELNTKLVKLIAYVDMLAEAVEHIDDTNYHTRLVNAVRANLAHLREEIENE